MSYMDVVNTTYLPVSVAAPFSQMSEDNLALSVSSLSTSDHGLDKSLMVDSVLQEAERLLTALSTMCKMRP